MFEPKDAAQVRDDAIAGIVVRTRLSNLRENAVLRQIIESFSVEMEAAWQSIHQLRDLSDPSKCHGEDLDAHARAVLPEGLDRRTEATFATGTVVFSRPAPGLEIPIPVGTVVSKTTPDGPVEYATAAAGAIPNAATTSAPVPVRCRTQGAVGSAIVGAVDALVTAIDGVTTVSNPAPIVGQDGEDDATLLQRMRDFVRGLPKCTPGAIEAAVRSAKLENGRSVRSAWAAAEPLQIGRGTVYVDDGAGTIEESEGVPAETLVAVAAGGEYLLYTRRRPWKVAPVVLKDGTQLQFGVAYTTEPSWGQIRLASPLVAGEALTVGQHVVYTGLVAEAQRVVDGDPTDRVGYPGFRAAFAPCRVLPAVVEWLTVEANVVVSAGYDPVLVLAAVKNAIVVAVNAHAPGQPVFWTALVGTIMAIRGVLKVELTQPAGDVHVPPNTVARTSAALVEVK